MKKKIDYSKCHFEFIVPSEKEKQRLREKIEKGDTEDIFVIHEMPDGTSRVVL